MKKKTVLDYLAPAVYKNDFIRKDEIFQNDFGPLAEIQGCTVSTH